MLLSEIAVFDTVGILVLLIQKCKVPYFTQTIISVVYRMCQKLSVMSLNIFWPFKMFKIKYGSCNTYTVLMVFVNTKVCSFNTVVIFTYLKM